MILFYLTGVFNWVITGGTILYDGKWHHVVATYDGAWMTLYIDGKQFSTIAKTGVITGTIIGSGASATVFYRGLMGIMRVYNRGLSAAEALASYRRDAWRVGLPG